MWQTFVHKYLLSRKILDIGDVRFIFYKLDAVEILKRAVSIKQKGEMSFLYFFKSKLRCRWTIIPTLLIDLGGPAILIVVDV